MRTSTSVVIADDHDLILRLLARHLEGLSDIEVVEAVRCAEDAVKSARKLRPDVVMMDIDMPGMSCFEAARVIQAECSGTRIIFLSSFFSDTYIDQALAVEAAGYLTKVQPPEAVVEAIRQVSSGRRWFSADVESRMVVDRDGVRLGPRGQSRASLLSQREREILRYVAQGMSQKQIAEHTHRSVKTIHKHCANIMAKLDIHDRVHLTRFAIREGLAAV